MEKQSEVEPIGRADLLRAEAKKFCEAVGLPEDLVSQIRKSESDWVFVLKVDALVEMATKEIVRHALCLKVFDKVVDNEELGDFIDGLPMAGKTSILKLLKASGCPDAEYGFIEAIRRVRNAYAHNIKCIDISLIELIKQRSDKSHLIKHLSAVESYEEASLITMYEKDSDFLRFCVMDSTMRVLFYAYHIALKLGPHLAILLTVTTIHFPPMVRLHWRKM